MAVDDVVDVVIKIFCALVLHEPVQKRRQCAKRSTKTK